MNLLDKLIQPFMYIFTGNKHSHWWHWEKVLEPNTKLWLITEKGKTYSRNMQNMTLVDLYKTLFVLKDVLIIEPESFTGYWSLIIKNKFYTSKCLIKHRGKIKNIVDGEKHYLGVTEEGNLIKLKLIRKQSRYKSKNLPFI